MILYLSGNFPQLSKIEKEQAMAEHNEKNGLFHLKGFYFCGLLYKFAANIKVFHII